MSIGVALFIAAVILFIVEAATSSTFALWFAIGAIVTAIFSTFITNPVILTIIFIAVTIGSLGLLRSKYINKLDKKEVLTSYNEIIGKQGRVVKRISTSTVDRGEVKVDGDIWTAEAIDDLDYEVNEMVEIIEISGAYVKVKKIN